MAKGRWPIQDDEVYKARRMFSEQTLFERVRATAEAIHPCDNNRYLWVALTSEIYEYLLCKDIIQEKINDIENRKENDTSTEQ